MHASKRAEKVTGRGFSGKVAVMGVLSRTRAEQKSIVKLEILPDTRTKTIDPVVHKHVEAGSTVYSDAPASYRKLEDEYVHHVIDHATEYVNGKIHTNGIENFWALLKRAIRGTYVSVEPFHLFRYLDEEAFRFNKRDGNDADRFNKVSKSITGKRLTYAQLTGKTLSTTPA